MEQQPYEDIILYCVDCGRSFIFTLAEQLYFQSKRLSTPKRCRPCRIERRNRIVPDSKVRHG